MRPNAKDMSIETLRGLAIILMVAGHVVGAHPHQAMQVSDDSPWRFVYRGLQDLRMPLFTVLSGYVYAMRPIKQWAGLGALARGKVIRLLVPLVTVGTLVFLAKLLNPTSTSGLVAGDWYKVYFFGLDHLWFLQAIFVIFLVVGLLDVLGTLDRVTGWAIATAVTAAFYVVMPIPNVSFFSINGAIRLLPFFLVGYGLNRFALSFSPVWSCVLGAAAIASLAPRTLGLYSVIEINQGVERALGLTIGIALILLLFRFREAFTNRFLAWLGGYAFGIYLFHYFALQAVWIPFRQLGFDNDAVEFIVAMTLGLGLPIALRVLTHRSMMLSLLLFGEKPRKRQRPGFVLATP